MMSNWSYPTDIRFGSGRLAELPEACETLKIKNPLFIIDRFLTELGILQKIFDLLKPFGIQYGIFSEVKPNPTEKNVSKALDFLKTGDYDGVIAFGGGSVLDVGKTVALMVGQTRPLWDFEDLRDYWKRANSVSILPVIAIPTTAGTGSEVGRASVIVNSQTFEKKIIFHPKMLPATVICDPDLTLTMPREVTAGTGLDAFAHCIEAFSSPKFHPMSQAIALEGMRLVIENLPRVYAMGSDIEARGNMMCAAMMGATAFQKGLGAVHAMSHPIGGLVNSHHGMTNAVCMLPVLRFNKPLIEDKFNKATNYLGIKGGFNGFCDFVEGFNRSLGVPKSLLELGVKVDQIQDLVAMALKDPSCQGNPIKLDQNNMTKLFEKACED